MPVEWRTPAEAARYEATPSYDETLAFLRRLERRLPAMRLEFFGESASGRPLPLVIVSQERVFAAEAARRLAKPIVLIQNGIHSGEIDGKDACLALLRDFALGQRKELLAAATLLVLPIYNVDGHERLSPWNRPNQDGPRRGMGFRTTADGSDLNRDYLKASTVEARHLLALFNRWRPHLFVDTHVTNGVDHDWVLTWSAPEAPQLAAPLDLWMRRHLPAALAATARAGHRVGPYVDLVDRLDPRQGFSSWVGEPRYSNGYLPLRQRPMVLIETHSHKPYEHRVLATRDLLLALLAEVGVGGAELRAAVAAAEASTTELGKATAPASTAVLEWEVDPAADRTLLPIYRWSVEPSRVTGGKLLRFQRGEVEAIEVPWLRRARARTTAPRPRGYLVPPGWPQIEARLAAHGLAARKLTAALSLEVETFRVERLQHAAQSYQGLVRVEAEVERRQERRIVPAGSWWVPADQPDFEVAIQLLEPTAPDSLFAWGLLNSPSERKEWIDPWLLEDEAARLLSDPEIARSWREALADPAFAADSRARYLWWFRRTRWFDEQFGLLPTFRVIAVPPEFGTALGPALER